METNEKQSLQKRSFRVGGMYCINCQNIIERELKKAGVKKASVNYRTGYAAVTYYDAAINFEKISSIIKELDYQVLEESDKSKPLQNKTFLQIAGTLVIILALFMLMKMFSTSGIAAFFPLAKEGMGYGMLIVIGILTSVHCIAMCGGINLSQTLGNGTTAPADKYTLLLPGILYNGGRLVSYTFAGIIIGALGSVITLTGYFQGAVQIAAGIFMLIMGLNMLGFLPFLRYIIPQMPKIFSKKIDEQKTGRGPLVVGFLNGFMPCGPLQAMQVYALSTGSPLKGGISMFLFCAGTIPLMFALSAASGVLSGAKGKAFSRRVMQIGAVLVAALGLVMFTYGLNLSGFGSVDNTASAKPAPESNIQNRAQIQGADKPSESNAFVPVIENGVQIVKSTLRPNRYPAITVQQGIPVRWTINAPPGSITGCNYSAIFYDYGFEYAFQPGENIIEFTPEKTGRFRYSCWMGMIRSTITVVAEPEKEG